jgi:hypothetical protein
MKDKLNVFEAISLISIIIISQIILAFTESIINLSRNWEHCKYAIFRGYFTYILQNSF